MSVSRKELRTKSAELINSLSKAELRAQFGISRVAEITGLDSIGVPVYNAIRPLSESLMIHSGKGLTREAARAGAILEGIEFSVATQPHGQFIVRRACEIPDVDRLELADCFPARASVVNDVMPVAWEFMTNIQNGAPKFVPSDLVWLTSRIKNQPLMYFQGSTNGLASGANVEDAILSGLYEVIERDAWTINQYLLDNYGILPTRVPLTSLPPALKACLSQITASQIKLHLFDITNDYRVPVFSAILLDFSGNVAGTFAGFGCHLDAETAALRAITEAVQGRCCYINGARDDMFRRQFLVLKRVDQAKLDAMFTELPLGGPLTEYRRIEFPDVRTELRYLLKFVRQFGVSEVYVKEMGAVLEGAIQIVRVVSPQCEPYRFDHWTPGFRCLSYCQRKMEELAGKRKEPEPEGEWKEGEGEAWKEEEGETWKPC